MCKGLNLHMDFFCGKLQEIIVADEAGKLNGEISKFMVCWFTDTLIYFSEGVIKIKRFFETFVICFILCGIFLFFGSLIMESVIAVIATIALFFTILISSYLELQTKIEALENRIKALEPMEEQGESEMQENENKLV